ncbi:MAG: DUF2490 domain-containing protein [Methylovulum sp.]|nr:DUF2490 domain-containing protein [Methylovulum sp.]
MSKNKTKIIGGVFTLLGSALFVQPTASFADTPTDNMFGVWGSLTLQGDFKFLSPGYDKFKWQVMNQSRTREDSPDGSRLTENLLFSQVGYQMNENASLWIGYVHDWIHPLDKPSYNESRPYQDFVWKQSMGDFKLMSRTRMEERINQTTSDTGYRPRQLLQISHPLPFMKGLSAYVGDEVLFYVNQNKFGKQGFSENRIFSGLSYQITEKMGMDLGYMGQYVDNIAGNNLFTHNLQANISYKF